MGNRYGRLLVQREGVAAISLSGNRQRQWHCLCDCGEETLVRAAKLSGGHTKSCGCLQKEVMAEKMRTHGLRKTRAYRVWAHMKNRCYNTSYPRYNLWGGRGITVCEEWRDDFAAFFEAMGECPDGMSIDRIDNDRGYEPGNCRWATPSQQANNLRTTRRYSLEGVDGTLTEWAERWGCSRDAIKLRLKRGATFEVIAAALAP